MLDVLLVTFQLGLNIALPAWIITRDMRRLAPEERSRAWNRASFWSAVVVFGPLCLPVHFVRVHRSVRGLGRGVLSMFGAFAASALLTLLLGLAAASLS